MERSSPGRVSITPWAYIIRLFAGSARGTTLTGVPLRSLVVQTLVTLGLVIGFGLYQEGFDRLVDLHGALLLGIYRPRGRGLIVLRLRAARLGLDVSSAFISPYASAICH